MTKKVWIGITLLVLLVGVSVLFILRPDMMGTLWQTFTSPDTFRRFVQSAGIWAPLLFFLLQTLQVIISPIPGGVTTAAGGAIFGVVPGFLLSSFSVLLGSLIGFYIGRRYGQKLVIKLIGQATFEKYGRFASGKYSLSLLIFFLIPFFPDDALCLIAGLSPMPVRVFVFFLFIGRLPTILPPTLIGAGVLVFSWWEWIAIVIISLLVIAFFLKYGDAFERWALQKIPQKVDEE